MIERENLLRIFKETKEAVGRGDSAKINSLSNQTVNSASLLQDPDRIAVAVIVYSLSKILSKEDYRKLSGWDKFYKDYMIEINKIIIDLERNDDQKFREHIEHIRKIIDKLSGGLKENVQDVFRKASINKASKIYEHGISMEKTAKLLGVSVWELASYAGGKEFAYSDLGKTIDVKSRIKLAMDFFR